MLETVDADEDTDWVPDVDVGLEEDFLDLLDMVVADQSGAKIGWSS